MTQQQQQKWLKSLHAVISRRRQNLQEGVDQLIKPIKWKGINNMGATCYISVILQLWFHVPEFKECILNKSPVNQVTSCLRRILLEMEHGNQTVIDCSPLVHLLQIDPSIHQDALEFYRLLSAFVPFNSGSYRHSTRCLNCRGVSSLSQPFTQFELNLSGKSATLQECIDRYFAAETLEDQYMCDACGPSRAERFVSVDRFPEILSFQLLRFKYAMQRNTFVKQKSSCILKFPPDLDLSAYGGGKYELRGVLIHHGDIDSGHYLSNLKTKDGWFQFDDSSVYAMELDARNVFDLRFNSGKRHEYEGCFWSRNVYMLVYSPLAPVVIGDDVMEVAVPSNEEVSITNESILASILAENAVRQVDVDQRNQEQVQKSGSEEESVQLREKVLEIITHSLESEHVSSEDSIYLSKMAIMNFMNDSRVDFACNKEQLQCPHENIFNSSDCVLVDACIENLVKFDTDPFRFKHQCVECMNQKIQQTDEKQSHSSHIMLYKSQLDTKLIGSDIEMGYISKRWLTEWMKKAPQFDKHEPMHALRSSIEAERDKPIVIHASVWNISPMDYPFCGDVICRHNKTPISLGNLKLQPMQALEFLRTIYPTYKPLSERNAVDCESCKSDVVLGKHLDSFLGRTQSGLDPRNLIPGDSELIMPAQNGVGSGCITCQHGHLQIDVFEHRYVDIKYSNPGFIFLSQEQMDILHKAGYVGDHMSIGEARLRAVCIKCISKRRDNTVIVVVEVKGRKRRRQLEIEVLRSQKLVMFKMEVAQRLKCTTVDFKLTWFDNLSFDEMETCQLFYDGVLIQCTLLERNGGDDGDDSADVQEVGFKGTLLIQ